MRAPAMSSPPSIQPTVRLARTKLQRAKVTHSAHCIGPLVNHCPAGTARYAAANTTRAACVGLRAGVRRSLHIPACISLSASPRSLTDALVHHMTVASCGPNAQLRLIASLRHPVCATADTPTLGCRRLLALALCQSLFHQSETLLAISRSERVKPSFDCWAPSATPQAGIQS